MSSVYRLINQSIEMDKYEKRAGEINDYIGENQESRYRE